MILRLLLSLVQAPILFTNALLNMISPLFMVTGLGYLFWAYSLDRVMDAMPIYKLMFGTWIGIKLWVFVTGQICWRLEALLERHEWRRTIRRRQAAQRKAQRRAVVQAGLMRRLDPSPARPVRQDEVARHHDVEVIPGPHNDGRLLIQAPARHLGAELA